MIVLIFLLYFSAQIYALLLQNKLLNAMFEISYFFRNILHKNDYLERKK